MNDAAKTAETGLGASVMDYNPVNIMPEGKKQGDYFSTDDRPVRHVGDRIRLQAAQGRLAGRRAAELKKIAARSGEPGLAYATDEDTRGIDPDPHSVALRPGQRPGRVRQGASEAGGRELAERRRRHDQGRRRLPAGPPGVRHAAGAARRGDVRRLALRRRPVREPQPQGRREGRASRWRSCRPRSSAKRSSCSKSRSSATSRSTSRRSCTTTWPRRSGTTGARESIERGDYPAHDVILMWQDRILSSCSRR